MPSMHRHAAIAALVLVVALAGCGLLAGGGPQSDDRAVALRADIVDATEPVESYRYDLDIHITASAEDERRTVRGRGSGAVNVSAQLLSASTTVEDTSRRTYIDSDHAYIECGEPWGGWEQRNVSDAAEWSSVTPLGRQVRLLVESPVKTGENRTIDGRETVGIVAYPSTATLQGLSGTMPRGTDYDSDAIENVTYRMWVDAGSHRPVESELEIDIEDGPATAEATLGTTFSAYGEPTNISVPGTTQTDVRTVGCPG